MKIDRGKFLVLTASMAACVANEPPPAAPLDIPIAPTGVGTSAPPVEAAAASASASAAPLASTSEGHAATEGSPSSEGYAAAEGAGGPATCGQSSRRFDASRTGCDDSVGSGAGAPSCSRMKLPASACAPFPFPKQECDTWRANLKPRVADAAIACADRLTSAQVCDACNVYRCGNDALMGACPDPSAAADCRALSRNCPSVDRTECVALLSGMSAVGRGKMAACMKRSCDGLYSCSESL